MVDFPFPPSACDKENRTIELWADLETNEQCT
jgi:hypothetical protein